MKFDGNSLNKNKNVISPGSEHAARPRRSCTLLGSLDTIGININCPTSIFIVEHQYYITIPEIRDSGCHGSIRLVKSVSKNQFSDDIIIKKHTKSIFYTTNYLKISV